jgi:hypothetical protein
MKITAEYLHRKWKSISYYDGGYIQVEAKHALEWHVGYKEIDQKTLVIVSHKEPELLPPSKSIVVTKGLRVDGRWTLSFALMRTEQDGVFELLCADLITYSQTAENEDTALNLTVKRYKQWNKLLEHQRRSLMEESNRKGLHGELIYLCEVLDGGYPIFAAVQGWTGPDGADQDFVYADGWHEVKSVGVSASSVKISSLEQLANSDPGELVVMLIDKCAPERSGAISLGEQVDRTLERVREDADALSLLESKLMRYGFIDLPEYREQKYVCSGEMRFRVDADFPRLTADNVAPQIIETQYSISLAGIEDWRIED